MVQQPTLGQQELIDIYTRYYQDSQPTIELISSLTGDDKGNTNYNELITNYSLNVLREYGHKIDKLGPIHRLDLSPDNEIHQQVLRFEGLKLIDPMLVDDLLIVMATLINTHLRYLTAHGKPKEEDIGVYSKSLGLFYIDVMKKEGIDKFFDLGVTDDEMLENGLHIVDWMNNSCMYAVKTIYMLNKYVREEVGDDQKVFGYPYLFTLLNREPYLYYIDSRDLQQRKEQRYD